MRRRELVVGLGASGLAGAAASALGGCAAEFSMTPVEPRRASASDIDRDPIALFPPGIIAYAKVDLTSLYATALGADFASFALSIVPLGLEANFSATRDTTRIFGGFYAMQGMDFCAVIQGRFDVAAIQRSADARAMSPAGGVPLVKTRYGGRDLYTIRNVGFTVLTTRTLLAGNETALRRVVDRLNYKELSRAVPAWMIALGETKNAGFAVAGDFGAKSVLRRRSRRAPVPPSDSIATPILESSAYRFPFLADLRMLRLVGNFQTPGLNFAGTLTYATPERARSGAEAIKSASQLAQWANMFTSFGFGAALPPIVVAVRGTDVGFVQPVDGNVARSLLQLLRN